MKAEGFGAAWWCRGAHAQTICGALARPAPKVPLRRERVMLPDGGFFDLDWMDGDGASPLVIVLPGLTNSSDAPYIRTLLDEIRRAGWRAVVLNPEGSFGVTPLYETDHSGKTRDLDRTVALLLERRAADAIYLAGYSAGGNKVLKWLGEKRDLAPREIRKAAVVSVPYELEKAVANLDRGFNREVYTRRMLNDLRPRALAKARIFPDRLDAQRIGAARTFTDFDALVTAPANGFGSAQSYWRVSSCARYLAGIRRPALLIHAANDPFFRKSDLPLEAIRASAHLELALTEDGGHVGFVSGASPSWYDRWMEKKVLGYFLKGR